MTLGLLPEAGLLMLPSQRVLQSSVTSLGYGSLYPRSHFLTWAE